MTTLDRRQFIQTGASALAVWGATRPPSLLGDSVPATGTRPNIIFLLSDDQNNTTLGCYGHPIVKTPVLDSLAAQGTRYANAFVTTSICMASRASIFTGFYECTHGIHAKAKLRGEHAAASYPALLRKSGYRTGFIGKVHVKVSRDMFDVEKEIFRKPYMKKRPDGTERHTTELIVDEAIAFLSNQPADKPFCLSLSFNAVHAEDRDRKNQYTAPSSTKDLYTGIKMPRPKLEGQSNEHDETCVCTSGCSGDGGSRSD